MNRSSVVLVGLATAAWAHGQVPMEQAPSVRELVHELKTSQNPTRAIEALQRRPSVEVIPAVLELLSEIDKDRELALRAKKPAYEVLSSIGGKDGSGRLSIDDAGQVERLCKGVSEPESRIRSMCLLALGNAAPSRQARAVECLRRFLETESPAYANNAAVALGAIGSPASAALPALTTILIGTDPVIVQRWAAYRAGDGAHSERDVELDVRISVALARHQIGGHEVLLSDLALIPALDKKGKDAARDALARHVVMGLPGVRELGADDERRVVSCLIGLAADQQSPTEGRVNAVRALGVCDRREALPRTARAKARAALEAAAHDAQPQVMSLATEILKALKRH